MLDVVVFFAYCGGYALLLLVIMLCDCQKNESIVNGYSGFGGPYLLLIRIFAFEEKIYEFEMESILVLISITIVRIGPIRDQIHTMVLVIACNCKGK